MTAFEGRFQEVFEWTPNTHKEETFLRGRFHYSKTSTWISEFKTWIHCFCLKNTIGMRKIPGVLCLHYILHWLFVDSPRPIIVLLLMLFAYLVLLSLYKVVISFEQMGCFVHCGRLIFNGKSNYLQQVKKVRVCKGITENLYFPQYCSI